MWSNIMYWHFEPGSFPSTSLSFYPLFSLSLFLNTQFPSDFSCSSKNSVFKEVLTRIEGHPDCRNLPMISFLILPMQRITRLPLLMDVSPLKTYSSMSSGITSFSTLVCVTLNHSLIILTDLTSLSFFKCFYSSSVSCFLWHHSILSLLCLPLSCSTFVFLSPVFSQCLPGDSGVYAWTLRGFWILRKFGFNSLLPTAFFRHQYFIALDRVWCAWMQWIVGFLCMFVFYAGIFSRCKWV